MFETHEVGKHRIAVEWAQYQNQYLMEDGILVLEMVTPRFDHAMRLSCPPLCEVASYPGILEMGMA